MKKYLFLLTILFIGSSFKPTNQVRIFDFHFEANEIELTKKSFKQIEQLVEYLKDIDKSVLSLEVIPSTNKELDRDRYDELTFLLEEQGLDVERVLFYSSVEHVSEELKSLANKDVIRLSVEAIVEERISQTASVKAISKKSTDDEQTINGLPEWAAPIVQNYQNNAENFTIYNNAASRLKLADGSIIEIEAGTFVFEDGSPVDSPIEIETKIATNKIDAIFEELSTTFMDDILESRGMIFINAMSRRRQLRLAQGRTIAINVRTQDAEPNFQSFQGRRNSEDGTMNWTLNENRVKPITNEHWFKYYKLEKLSEEKRQEFIEYRKEQISLWEERGLSEEKIKNKLKRAKYHAKKRNKKVKERYKKKYKYLNENTERKRDKAKRKDFNLVRKSSRRNPNRYSSMHKIGMPKYEFVEYPRKTKRISRRYYRMNARGLGWTNIDRKLFEKREKTPKTRCDIIVHTRENENVKIIFDDYFVVLKGKKRKQKYKFKNLPRGERITIIAAKITEDNQIKYTSRKTRVSNKEMKLYNYQTGNQNDFIDFVNKNISKNISANI